MSKGLEIAWLAAFDAIIGMLLVQIGDGLGVLIAPPNHCFDYTSKILISSGFFSGFPLQSFH